jgi:hypothetical protein
LLSYDLGPLLHPPPPPLAIKGEHYKVKKG